MAVCPRHSYFTAHMSLQRGVYGGELPHLCMQNGRASPPFLPHRAIELAARRLSRRTSAFSGCRMAVCPRHSYITLAYELATRRSMRQASPSLDAKWPCVLAILTSPLRMSLHRGSLRAFVRVWRLDATRFIALNAFVASLLEGCCDL